MDCDPALVHDAISVLGEIRNPGFGTRSSACVSDIIQIRKVKGNLEDNCLYTVRLRLLSSPEDATYPAEYSRINRIRWNYSFARHISLRLSFEAGAD